MRLYSLLFLFLFIIISYDNIRPNEGLILETSALDFLYGG